ncbi:MAG: protein-tyrosine-phosphatase [Marinobacter maritimus]|jgi:protein-tyrosine-phosphatase
MIKVLSVCLGNICRSPTAHAALDMVKDVCDQLIFDIRSKI